MRQGDLSRIAIGIMVLMLPYAGTLTILPLALIFFLDREARLLSASLGLLVLMRPVLGQIGLDLPLYVIAISFIASTFAAFAFRRFEALAGSIIYLMTTVALGYPFAAMASSGHLTPERALFLAILGGLSGAFLQHAAREPDFTVPFGSCMVMWLFSFEYPLPATGRIVLISLFALGLGLGAYYAKAADSDAVMSATIIGVLVILFSGPAWFLLILSFYLLGGGFTKYGLHHKQRLGIAQAKGGVRGYKNVYSNSLVPLALAICHGIYGSDVFLYAFIAAVATANGDTLASEIGETSRSRPRMITTFKVTEHGVDGGVTPLGESAALMGSAVIGLLAVATGMAGGWGVASAIIGGFFGTNFDSFLGATLQRRGMLSNNGVNLFATLFGALVGAALWGVMQIV